jgi:predicted  nucleic acid-binding Zn-ribbon protein
MFDLITNIDIATEEACDNIMESMLLSYDKMVNIMRYDDNIDLDNFAIFQEGKIMDDVKERGKGQSKLKKIITFIPRLIMSIINFLKNKFLKKKDKNKLSEINKAIKDPKRRFKLKDIIEILGKTAIGTAAIGAVGAGGIKLATTMSLNSDLEHDISELSSRCDNLYRKNLDLDEKISEKDAKEALLEQIIEINDLIVRLEHDYDVDNAKTLKTAEALLEKLKPIKTKIDKKRDSYFSKESIKNSSDEYVKKYKAALEKFDKLYKKLENDIRDIVTDLSKAAEIMNGNIKIDGGGLKIKTNIKTAIKAINTYNEKMEEFFKSGKISEVSVFGMSAKDEAYEFVDSEELEKILYIQNASKLYTSLNKAHELGQKFYDEYVTYSDEYDGSIKKSKLSGNEDEDDKLQEFFRMFVNAYTVLSKDIVDSIKDIENISDAIIVITDDDSVRNAALSVNDKATGPKIDTSRINDDIKNKYDTKVKELKERDKEKKEG